jgi:hypothetical protein
LKQSGLSPGLENIGQDFCLVKFEEGYMYRSTLRTSFLSIFFGVFCGLAVADHASGINEDLPAGGDYRIGGITVLDTSNTQAVQVGPYTGTTAPYSTMVGYRAGQYATGNFNFIMGNIAGANNTGNRNVILGSWAGNVNTGSDNIFMGYVAGRYNTSGAQNVFLGTSAGFNNTTGYYNMMLGGSAGYANTTGARLTCIGFQSGYSNTSGLDNVALGYRAGYKNTTGEQNMNIGANAGYSEALGSRNVNVGALAGYSANGQSYNINIGTQAGYSNNGSYNVFIGYQADANPATAFSSIALGYRAVVNGNHQMVVGSADPNGYISTVYLGQGIKAATPQDVTLQATSASAGNVNGANLVLKGGTKSGTGTNGVVKVVGELQANVVNITGGSDLCEMFEITPATGNADMRALLLQNGASE